MLCWGGGWFLFYLFIYEFFTYFDFSFHLFLWFAFLWTIGSHIICAWVSFWLFLTGTLGSVKCCSVKKKTQKKTLHISQIRPMLHFWPFCCRIFTPKIIGNSPSHASADRLDHSGRKLAPSQQRPIPSIGQWLSFHSGWGAHSLWEASFPTAEPSDVCAT